MSKSINSLHTTQEEQRLVHAYQLLGDMTRYKIFRLLLSRDDMCVGDIAERVGVSPSATSQHFRNFELLGLVRKQRKGQKICYELNSEDSLVISLSKISQPRKDAKTKEINK